LRGLQPLHQKKIPGDWIRAHPEERPQTFEQYCEEHPHRLTDEFRRLCVQPLGDFSEAQRELVSIVADYLARVFGLPVEELAAIPASDVPQRARRVHPDWGDRQIHTAYLLDELLPPVRPDDAAALLALTAEDLYPQDDWNFVFGQASLTERVGVWSLYRYGDPAESDAARRLCLERMLKVASHETGHLLGLPHCVLWECGLNGSNSLPETDAAPLAFCHVCGAKIWWAVDLAPVEWHRGLAEFAAEQEFKSEAQFWQECLEELERS
jgi:archaemetzincin